jgi:hypothetical protein
MEKQNLFCLSYNKFRTDKIRNVIRPLIAYSIRNLRAFLIITMFIFDYMHFKDRNLDKLKMCSLQRLKCELPVSTECIITYE